MKILQYIAALTFFSLLNLDANSVATITALKGNVKIENSSDARVAILGDTLIESDSVITSKKAKAQIVFSDETIITVGKNSKFSISKYLYEESENVVAEFNLLRGSIQAITGHIGKIAPEKFHVRTKTATIGIRGTNFTVVVNDDNSFSAYCSYGAISVMVGGQEYIVEKGYILYTSDKGSVTIQKYSSSSFAKMRESKFSTTQKEAILEDVSQRIQDAIQTENPSLQDLQPNTDFYTPPNTGT